MRNFATSTLFLLLSCAGCKTDNPAESPDSVPQGMPSISVVVTSLDFGHTSVGTSTSVGFEIGNEGTAQLLVSLSLSDTGNFGVEGDMDFVVDVSALRPVLVHFEPHTIGMFHASLSILSNDTPGSPVVIDLVGSSEVSSGPPDTIIVLASGPRTITTVNGTGPTTAIAGFQVLDSLSQPLGLAFQHDVSFILTGTPSNGGAWVSPHTHATDDLGTVYTTVNSGTAAGILELTARIFRNSDGRIIESMPDTIFVE